MQKKILFIILCLVSLVSIPHQDVFARVGGGESYDDGGSSDSYSSDDSYSSSSYSDDDDDDYSSSGGGGELPPWVFGLIFVLIVIAVIVNYIKSQIEHIRNYFRQKEMEHIRKNFPEKYAFPQGTRKEIRFENLREKDPGLSLHLLSDFTALLFNRIFDAKNPKDFQKITPFLAPQIRDLLKNQNSSHLIREIIGTTKHLTTVLCGDIVCVNFEVITNVDVSTGNKIKKVFLRYHLLLTRNSNDTSLPEDRLLSLNCPSCGAASEITDAGACNYCNTLIVDHGVQWKLYSMEIREIRVLKTIKKQVPTYSVERGTNDKTKFHKNLEEKQKEFCERHSIRVFQTFTEEFFKKTVSPTFLELYNAWTNDDWKKTLPYTTDRLHESLAEFLEENRLSGFKNVLKEIKIYGLEIAKIEKDGPIDAITVRIHASCIDYYTNLQGKVLSGNTSAPRRFSEYWTFIRSQEVKKEGDHVHCPSCGAEPDKIGKHAICGNCGTKINSGVYGWVLTAIDQDEAYKP